MSLFKIRPADSHRLQFVNTELGNAKEDIGKIKMELRERKAELDEIKKQIKPKKSVALKSVKEKNLKRITTAIQILIFHYLEGLALLTSGTNSEKAELLSVMFKTEGFENLRRDLSNVGGNNSKLLIKKNLIYVRDLFQRVGYVQALEKVNRDIEKLNSLKRK
jgi:hypothetical protein